MEEKVEEVVVQEEVEESAPIGNIYARMVEAMASIETLPKNGKNTHYGFSYVTDEDVLNTMRHALSKAGIAMVPSVESVASSGNIVMVWLNVLFYSMDDGSCVKIHWPGYAPSNLQDKAVTVAITNGIKYCLLKTFIVSTGDESSDGDSDSATVGQAKQSQQARQPTQQNATKESTGGASDKQKAAIVVMLKKLGGDSVDVDKALEAKGYPGLQSLSKSQASELFKRLQEACNKDKSPSTDPF